MRTSVTRKIVPVLALAAAITLPAYAAGAERLAFELSLGVSDIESATWDGELRCPEGLSIEVAGVLDLYPKDRGGLALSSERLAHWTGGSKCEVMRSHQLVGANIVRDPKGEPIRYPLRPYSVMIQLTGNETNAPVTIGTKQLGQFQFAPGDLKYGRPATFLEGRASVARAVATVALGTCEGEDGAIRYNDFPAVCADPDGGAWIAYLAYTGSNAPRLSLKEEPKDFDRFRQAAHNDQLLVVREQGGEYSQPVAITGPGLDLLAPAVACNHHGRTAAFWSQGTEGNWDLYVSVHGGGGWSAPVRLTTDAGPDIHAVAATSGDEIWVAWQGFRGGTSRILLGRLRADGSALEPVVEVTDGTANCWRPAIAADGPGNLAVAYDTYAKGDYDVHCVVVSPQGAVQREIAVATSLCYEAHASVSFDPLHRLWLAWEQAGENWGKDYRTDKVPKQLGEPVEGQRTLRVACWSDRRLLTTKTPLESVLPLQQTILTSFEKNPVHTRESLFKGSKRYAFYPRLACGSNGHVYLAYRQHDYLPDRSMSNQTIWSDFVAVYEGDQWLHPVRVAGSDGQRHSAPAICAVPGGLTVACAGDGRASNAQGACDRTQNVRSGRLRIEATGPAPVLVEQPMAKPLNTPASVLAERAAVRRIRDYRVTVAGQPLRILRGDTHRHTAFSPDSAINDGCIEDAFRYALDAAALDFLSNGDHDNGGSEYAWYLTQKFYDVHFLPGAFVPMFGYERSRGESGIGGHRNVLMAERGIRVLPPWKQEQTDAAGSVLDTQVLFRFLRHFGGVSIPHTIGTHAGPNFVDQALDVDPVVEIYQGARDAYEYPGCPRGIQTGNEPGFFWSLLKAGKKYGVIASSDHTSTHMSYAMLYVSDVSRQGVLDALRRRHCYAATDNILLDVRAGDGHLMGDAFTASVAPVLSIHAVGTGPIKQIDIIRNAGIVQTIPVGQSTVQTEWTDDMPPAGENSYYVRVLQENGELAWGSPMWITGK